MLPPLSRIVLDLRGREPLDRNWGGWSGEIPGHSLDGLEHSLDILRQCVGVGTFDHVSRPYWVNNEMT